MELEKLLYVKIQTVEKGTNTDLVDKKNEKDAYIAILSINNSPKISKDECSKNKTLDTWMPYRHHDYNSHRIIQ